MRPARPKVWAVTSAPLRSRPKARHCLPKLAQSGPQELLKTYQDLLRFTEQSGLLKPAQTRSLLYAATGSAGAHVLAACRELREAAADVFYARLDQQEPSATSLKILARLFKEAHSHQQLNWNESRLEWDWPETETLPELPLWMLSLSAAGLMLSSEMQRVRACEKPDCRWLFLDTSKNHTRRWCDMKICGNRMKARRFKAQRNALAANGA